MRIDGRHGHFAVITDQTQGGFVTAGHELAAGALSAQVEGTDAANVGSRVQYNSPAPLYCESLGDIDHPCMLMRAGTARIALDLDIPDDETVAVFALEDDGSRGERLPSVVEDGTLRPGVTLDLAPLATAYAYWRLKFGFYSPASPYDVVQSDGSVWLRLNEQAVPDCGSFDCGGTSGEASITIDNSLAGLYYVIEWRDGIADGEWSVQGSGWAVGNGGSLSLVAPQGDGHRFYRARVTDDASEPGLYSQELN